MLLIITFPIALSVLGYTAYRLLKYAFTRDITHLKVVFAIWLVPLLLIGWSAFNSPTSVWKKDIIGTYEIDSNFYPGENANWQKELFSFVINEENELLFYEKLADGSFKVVKGKVHYYRDSSPAIFRIELDKPHKLIDPYPALYRQRFGFYYVFESAFGNMFYRKVSSSTASKEANLLNL